MDSLINFDSDQGKINPIGGLIDKLKPKLNIAKTQRERLAGDLDLLRKDPMKLGYTQGQQRQMVDQAAQNAQAQRAAQTQQMGQQALAGQGFQQGAFSQAARQIGADAAQEVAQASSDVASLNEQKIQSEKERVLQEAEALRNRRAQRTQFWAQFGLNGLQTIGELIGLGSGPSGGGAPASVEG